MYAVGYPIIKKERIRIPLTGLTCHIFVPVPRKCVLRIF
jgi:hypothetical protein